MKNSNKNKEKKLKNRKDYLKSLKVIRIKRNNRKKKILKRRKFKGLKRLLYQINLLRKSSN
jgi:hypothetical protein